MSRTRGWVMRRRPSGRIRRSRARVSHTATAWLTLAALAHNLTRALGCLASAFHVRARTGTIRHQLVAVPARLASGGRTLTFHLPERWPWQDAFETLWTAVGCRLQT
ncbi:transposase [Streptomyces chiangmaiensis]|uniref:Transposase DDE domain-containing protein n=1 Tax=Streptomyces chiangmaiensis TaxID=766497 RepID=A0ABU7G0F0_9ACTN|nr:hypothetical protein [Streptomyces chiangmaiensis]MED7828849.1 hypothetical protein [Streptomyces chiangmaiensis]